jgi:hypothetical protein
MQDRLPTEPASAGKAPEQRLGPTRFSEAEFRARLQQLEDFVRFLLEGRANLRVTDPK